MRLHRLPRKTSTLSFFPLKVRTSTTCHRAPRPALNSVASSPCPSSGSLRHLANVDPLTAGHQRLGRACTPAPTAALQLRFRRRRLVGLWKSACVSKARASSFSARVARPVPPSSASSSGSKVYICRSPAPEAAALARRPRPTSSGGTAARETALRRRHQPRALRHDRHQTGAAHRRERAERSARF